MKNLNIYTTVLCILLSISAFAQVQINKQIQLTGSGTDGKVTGIRSVTDSLDATSAEVVQNGSLIYAVATGSGNNFSITVSPPVTAYKAGMAFNFISNQTVSGAATLNVNNLGVVPIKKYFNQDFAGCEIQNGQVVTVVYDGTNFQITSAFSGPATVAYAGPDQINVSGVEVAATLGGNTAVTGTGAWSVDSGVGGSFTNPASPNSTFHGISGHAYILTWTITGQCSSSSDNVYISFLGTQTFSFTGVQQTFTVPAQITQLALVVYGAQGGSGTDGPGGLGGSATGTLTVTPGDVIYVFVGGQPGGTAAGFNGGGTGVGAGGRGGGGASDIRVGGIGLGNRVIVAGGGGGTTSAGWSDGGGTGGGTTGGNGTSSNGGVHCGQGGTQNAGGAGATAYGDGNPGTLGQGGNASPDNNNDPGGGGGYYGGGGGAAGGAGGGSGYTDGVSNGVMQSGVQSGNGLIIISW